MKPFIVLIRPHQWIKNSFIFMPLFFGLGITNEGLLLKTGVVFAGFCLTASGIYVFNDLFDRAEDRLHPQKQSRPLASGAVRPHTAQLLSAGLLFGGFGLISFAGWAVMGVGLSYILLNVIYTVKAKHIPILDVTAIAVGFVLRLYAGSYATGVPLSEWILITTFLLALFLALAKRRDDALIFFRDGAKTRKLIDGYSIEFLNAAMIICATVALIAYLMYSVSPEVTARIGSHRLYLTNLFVLVGMLRYFQITLVNEQSGNPAKVVLTDRFLQITIASWLSSFFWLLYL